MATQRPRAEAIANAIHHLPITAGSINDGLSPRERQCLLMTATGASDADVASRISISESTVRFHLRNAARKLSASCRREAIYLAAKSNLI